MAYNKEYYQKNRKRLMEAQQRYRARPEIRERYLQKAKESSRIWYSSPENRLKRQGYNRESWLRQVKKLEEKAGRPRPDKCEICGEGGVIAFDHNHKTGKFRGWICVRCNITLGKVNDDEKILQALISYLKSSK